MNRNHLCPEAPGIQCPLPAGIQCPLPAGIHCPLSAGIHCPLPAGIHCQLLQHTGGSPRFGWSSPGRVSYLRPVCCSLFVPAPEAHQDRGAVYLWSLLAEPRLSHPELHHSEGRQVTVLPGSFPGSHCCGVSGKCPHTGVQARQCWTHGAGGRNLGRTQLMAPAWLSHGLLCAQESLPQSLLQLCRAMGRG